MCANRIINICGLGLMIVWIISCTSTLGPKGWLPSPNEALSDAFGAWMIVEYSSGSVEKTAEGEFITVEKNKVYLLTTTGLEEIPIPKVQHVTFATYEERMVGAWAVLGFFSTASHGFYAAASAPIWLIGGILNASAESTSGVTKSDSIVWYEIRKYARFPQGIPQGIDLRQLKPKPFLDKKP